MNVLTVHQCNLGLTYIPVSSIETVYRPKEDANVVILTVTGKEIAVTESLEDIKVQFDSVAESNSVINQEQEINLDGFIAATHSAKIEITHAEVFDSTYNKKYPKWIHFGPEVFASYKLENFILMELIQNNFISYFDDSFQHLDKQSTNFSLSRSQIQRLNCILEIINSNTLLNIDHTFDVHAQFVFHWRTLKPIPISSIVEEFSSRRNMIYSDKSKGYIYSFDKDDTNATSFTLMLTEENYKTLYSYFDKLHLISPSS